MRVSPEESRLLLAGFIKMDKELLEQVWKYYDFRVTLSQSQLASLEEQTRWARRNGLGSTRPINYLDFIYSNGLMSVNPEAVKMVF